MSAQASFIIITSGLRCNLFQNHEINMHENLSKTVNVIWRFNFKVIFLLCYKNCILKRNILSTQENCPTPEMC